MPKTSAIERNQKRKRLVAKFSAKFDGQGNYNLGITDFTIFPEITVENVKKQMGLDITIVTTAQTDDEGRELLKLLGMPFRRTETTTAPKAA